MLKSLRSLAKPFVRMLQRQEQEIVCGDQVFLKQSDYELYQRLHLVPLKILTASVENLHCEISLDFDAVTQHFFRTPDHYLNRNIKNSPHFKLLSYYDRYGLDGLKRNFRKQEYFDFFMSFNEVGQKTNLFNGEKIRVHYEEEHVLKKMINFIHSFEALRLKGYLSPPYQTKYIAVLKIPLIVSRYGKKYDFSPYTIFSGHHRAASLAFLGFEEIKVLLLEDSLSSTLQAP